MKTLILLLMLPLASPLMAQTTYAVVVGVADYRILDYKTGDLRYADEDAARFAAFLQSAAGGSIPRSQIVLLTNRAATQAAIFEAVRIFRNATAQDRIIFYFSGHGLRAAFVPYDVQKGNPASLLTHAEVKAAFKASAATTKLIVADACFSGSMKPKKTSQGYRKNAPTDDNLQVAMLLSSRSSQQSIEASLINGGVFTYFVLNGLRGYADANGDRFVTIRELYNYVAPRIKKSTPNGQAPVFSGKFSNDLVLSRLN